MTIGELLRSRRRWWNAAVWTTIFAMIAAAFLQRLIGLPLATRLVAGGFVLLVLLLIARLFIYRCSRCKGSLPPSLLGSGILGQDSLRFCPRCGVSMNESAAP